jgi:pullulanase
LLLLQGEHVLILSILSKLTRLLGEIPMARNFRCGLVFAALLASTAQAKATNTTESLTAGAARVGTQLTTPVRCEGDTWQQVLQPASVDLPTFAGAVFANQSMIVWPRENLQLAQNGQGVSNTFRYVLVGTQVQSGSKDNAEVRIELSKATAQQTRPVALGYLGDAELLVIPALSRAQWLALIQGEMRVQVEEFPAAKDAAPSTALSGFRVVASTRLQHAWLLDELFAAAKLSAPLGVDSSSQGSTPTTHIRLWAPTARAVQVCIKGQPEPSPMQFDANTGIWSIQLNADQARRGTLYRFMVDVQVPGLGLVRNRVTDPYSLSLNANSQWSAVANLSEMSLKPAGWDRLQLKRTADQKNKPLAATDLSIYELHVRDFSANDPTVPAALRGKYGAFGVARSAGMQHLRRLRQAGLTDIHFLPFFDLATVPELDCKAIQIPAIDFAKTPSSVEPQAIVTSQKQSDCFNWGYDPLHFNAPEGSFSIRPDDALSRVLEIRQMIAQLQTLGFRVGMDVVYNHTSAAGQSAQSVLDRIVPGYYQRLNSKGEVETSTCCSNTATEHMMMARLMIDSAIIWAREYGIDSFRFDLMGHQPRDAMLELQKQVDAATGRHIHLIGEGWNFGEVANGRRFVQASQLSLPGTGIGTFSDRSRDAVRGGGCCDSGQAAVNAKGFVNRYGHTEPSQGRNTSSMPTAGGPTAGGATAGGPTAGLTTSIPASRSEALAQMDMVRVGLAGTVQDFQMRTASGMPALLKEVRYGDQPAGYAKEPGEVVNYVENHDNQTLFDVNVFKLPMTTSAHERARVQILALSIPLLSQGVAYFHAGGELLRSKSLDRNSYDSGDWFNRIDWSARTNYFPMGLPLKQENFGDKGADWEVMRRLLDNPAIRVTDKEIRWTRDQFLALLKIRSNSPELRLRTTAAIRDQLRFYNLGPDAVEGLLVGEVKKRSTQASNLKDGKQRFTAYLINSTTKAIELRIPDWRGRNFKVHPYLKQGPDRLQAEVKFDAKRGLVRVPARTVTVLVQ